MIKFKDFKDLTFVETYLIADYLNNIDEYLPVVDSHDYLMIKKYIRKILEIIEKDKINKKDFIDTETEYFMKQTERKITECPKLKKY